MREYFKQLTNNPFIRNVIIIASGTAGAQAITMIFAPIITRMYGPDAFGVMGTFTALTRIIIPIAALTYPVAIVLPKDDRDAKGLIHLSLIVTGVISSISLILIMLLNEKIVSIFDLEEIQTYLYLIPLVVIFAGLMQVAEQWLIRTKQFAINARVTIYQSLIINTSKLGIGFFHPVATVLIILTVVSNGIRALMMILFAKKSKYNSNVIKANSKPKSIKKLAKNYYDFPLYRAPEEFLNAVSNGLPILMLTAFFGPASAGFYSIVRSVMSIPSQLIGKSVGDVFYPRIAEALNNNEDLTKLISKATLALAGVGIIPYGIIIFFGPSMFSFIFGSEWVVAGEYARWIAMWSYVAFMNRPSVKALPVLNAQRFQLIYTTFMLITRLSVLAITYYIFSSDIIAVASFGVAGALLNVGLITITINLSKKRQRR